MQFPLIEFIDEPSDAMPFVFKTLLPNPDGVDPFAAVCGETDDMPDMDMAFILLYVDVIGLILPEPLLPFPLGMLDG